MTEYDVIVIGAGAAGLMAAATLAKEGKRVLVLEANDRIGGRIHTIHIQGFTKPLELGAEFIHGELPVTFSLLAEAGIGYTASGGEMWRAVNGKLTHEEHYIKDWNLFEKHLEYLQEDMSINAFLDKYFSDDSFEELRISVRNYAAGYDNANPDRASALALRKEWLEEDNSEAYRVDGGYASIISYLAETLATNNGTIIKNAMVTEIMWQQGGAKVMVAGGQNYQSPKCIIAVPLGVLQRTDHSECSIKFIPAIPDYNDAFGLMGMGSVIKVLLVFKQAFWKGEEITRRAQGSMEHMVFLFSDEAIPTWWTQCPDDAPVLTGWLGGYESEKLINATNEEILILAKTSLSSIFQLTIAEIDSMLQASFVGNWAASAYSRGSYSYATIDAVAALKTITQPVLDTIYFAGEALYTGSQMGTVEAALANGKQVAEQILGIKR